jgi:FHA domain
MSFELKPGANRFGRSEHNDHPLNDPAISEEHCEIMVENDFVFVRDLGSTNGTFIDRRLIKESALYTGQTLQIGPLEMILDGPPVQVAIPELPPVELPPELIITSTELDDGFPACLNHDARHAVWECGHCTRVYCDECVRKVRRVGGVHLRLCSACSHPCKLTAWSEMVKKRKRSVLRVLADKVKSSFKRSTQMFAIRPKPAVAEEKRRGRKR